MKRLLWRVISTFLTIILFSCQSSPIDLPSARIHTPAHLPTIIPEHLTIFPKSTRYQYFKTQTPVPDEKTTPDMSTGKMHPSPYLTKINEINFISWQLIHDLAFSPDGEYLAVALGSEIQVYSIHDLSLKGLVKTSAWVTCLSFDQTGDRLASTTRDGHIQIWQFPFIINSTPVKTINAHKKSANAVQFSPNGSLIATSGNDAMARIWNADGGELISELIGGAYAIPFIKFTHQGKGLAIVNHDLIRIRDIETTRFIDTLSAEDSLYSLTINQNNEYLAAGSVNGNIYIWSFIDGKYIRFENQTGITPDILPGLIWELCFLKDNNSLLIAQNNGNISIWNIATWQEIDEFPAHQKAVSALAIHPSGNLIASGGLDARVILWKFFN